MLLRYNTISNYFTYKVDDGMYKTSKSSVKYLLRVELASVMDLYLRVLAFEPRLYLCVF